MDPRDDDDEIELAPTRNGSTFDEGFWLGYQEGVTDAQRDVGEATKRKRRAKAASGSRAKKAKQTLTSGQRAAIRNYNDLRHKL